MEGDDDWPDWFHNVDVAPAIEVFALTAAYNESKNPQKVNLGVGAYRDEDGKPWVLPVVRSVEAQMAADKSLNHEYLPVAGLQDYRDAGVKVLLGSESPAIAQNRADAVQAVGGTGALRLGLDLLRNKLGLTTVLVSSPTWGNHKGIAKSLHYEQILEYPYWSAATCSFDCDAMVKALRQAPKRSVALLHMCAHNPTGMDPTTDQWTRIMDAVKERHHFPFFDCAYQGFASGDLDVDAAPLRQAVTQGFTLLAAQSFSKNFGLYNERVGNLVYVCRAPEHVTALRSQLMKIVRETWSNSPAHGVRVVATILNNPAFCNEWKGNVKAMAARVILMRQNLYQRLRDMGTPGAWGHITAQAGMFSYTGLNPRQVAHLKEQYHIFLLTSGRINMCGLTLNNVDHVAKAIDDAVRNIDDDPKL